MATATEEALAKYKALVKATMECHRKWERWQRAPAEAYLAMVHEAMILWEQTTHRVVGTTREGDADNPSLTQAQVMEAVRRVQERQERMVQTELALASVREQLAHSGCYRIPSWWVDPAMPGADVSESLGEEGINLRRSERSEMERQEKMTLEEWNAEVDAVLREVEGHGRGAGG